MDEKNNAVQSIAPAELEASIYKSICETLAEARKKVYTSINFANDFNIGGNKISLKTLDLNRDWKAITEQLESLCWWRVDGQPSIRPAQPGRHGLTFFREQPSSSPG